jgi:hypothetical protein
MPWEHKWFGLFAQRTQDRHLPDLRQFLTRPEPYPDLERIIDYLETAPILFATFRSAYPDPIDGSRGQGSVAFRTDGEWSWYDHLGYYLRKYPLELPDALLARIRAHGYVVPDVDDACLSGLDYPPGILPLPPEVSLDRGSSSRSE